jgi:monoterpene epsilon-lactone hydrolase
MPSPEAARAIQEWRDLVSGPRGTLDEMRQHADDYFANRPLLPGLKVEHAEVGGVPGDWLTMPGADAARVVLYIHGGAFVLCSPRGYRPLGSRIAKAMRARTFLVDYRLAPEHPFPAAIQDSADAYRGILAQGVAPSSIVIAGDSAGGNLVIATLLSLRDSAVPLPAAGVCISPWVDLECVGESMKSKADVDPLCTYDSMIAEAALYLNGHSARDPLASPIHADLRGLPPLLIQVGTEETLLDDSTRLARRAEESGVTVRLEVFDGMPHVWHAFASYLPEGQEAIDKIGQFVDSRTAKATSAS